MKKVLITGTNSYIGTSFEKWCLRYPDKYLIDSIDMRDGLWKKVSFTGYDAVFHVAGIAHIREKRKNTDLYYKINRDLTSEVANKSKNDGVKQFIFMSSASIYGIETGIICKDTRPAPKSNYGKSKLQAEIFLDKLSDENFKLVILRPPMIYGKGCKGNYLKLSKIARKIPVFPNIDNKRSMLHIDNLCEFIRLLIEYEEDGVFFPQNKEYVKTSEMVNLIARINGKEIKLTKIFNFIINFLKNYSQTLRKIFGSLIYEQNLSSYKTNYQVKDLLESIVVTEKENILSEERSYSK